MKLDYGTAYVAALLRRYEFAVERIPESQNERRADLRATADGDEYVIEVKAKDPSERWQALLTQARTEGEAITTNPGPRPLSAISRIIDNADDQLAQTPASADAFRILWFVATHDDGDFLNECIEQRACGITTLVTVPTNIYAAKVLPCFGYAPNDFRRHRELDAVIISALEGIHCYLNPYAPRAAFMRSTHLYTLVNQVGTVHDPEHLETRGEALLIRDDFTPNDDGSGHWEYLLAKYGLKTSPLQPFAFTGLMTATITSPE